MTRKGIVLAGGSGSRLYPVTFAMSKQLVPVYDKLMIYYPLSILMLAGIQDIAVITTPQDAGQFQRALGDGSQWGVHLHYIKQPAPEGLAQAYTLAEAFLDGAPSAMVLGDNIFFGNDLRALLSEANRNTAGATVFGYRVKDPERYGVLAYGEHGRLADIVEKPKAPPSSYAVTGLYFLDATAPERSRDLRPSPRGELEMTDLLRSYLRQDALRVARMGRGFAWLDTGTHDSLLDAGNFVRALQNRQGLQSGCLEEIALSQGWITADVVAAQAQRYGHNAYGDYLRRLLD